jgi:D-3-phosphoglycerate dehydrogenase
VLRGADVALVQFARVSRTVLEQLRPGARVIRYGVGYDNIDISAARALGIEVAYVPDYCTDEVADHTASLILAVLRGLVAGDNVIRSGSWNAVEICRPLQSFETTEVGFLGIGRIGRALLERLRPFKFRFIANDPALTAAKATELGVRPVDLEELFVTADVLTLHVPSSAETHHVVNERRLRLMKPTAFVVNTARGDLVDSSALAHALRAEWIRGAALDVFDSEPLSISHPLRHAPRVLMTPHMAWYSDQAIDRLQQHVADELHRALAGDPPRSPVPDCVGTKL